MIFPRYIALVFIVFMGFFSLYAQPTKEKAPVTSIIYDHNQEFTFRPGRVSERHQISNILLQTIAEGNNALRVFTSYSFAAQLYFELSAGKKEETYELRLEVKNPFLSGDTQYKDFSLEDLLIPGMLNSEILIAGEDGSAIKSIVLEDIDWQEKGKEFLIQKVFLDKKPHKLRIQKIEFYYNESSLEEISFWNKAFLQYYASEKALIKMDSICAKIQDVSPENIVLQDFALCEAENLWGEIHYAAFHQFEEFKTKDPLNIYPRKKNIDRQIRKLRSEFNYMLSHLDSLFYSKGEIHLQNGKIQDAQDLFQRSLSYNPGFIPSHIALANIDLKEENPQEVYDRLLPSLQQKRIAGIWHDDMQIFLQHIYQTETDRAERLSLQGNHLDALNLLLLLEEFCTTNNYWDCSESLFGPIQTAHYGMYRSYLAVAKRAYQSSNFSFAEMYLTDANQYQKANTEYIKMNTESRVLLRQVLAGYRNIATEALQVYDYERAILNLERAEEICKNNPDFRCHEMLAQTKQQAIEKQSQRERTAKRRAENTAKGNTSAVNTDFTEEKSSKTTTPSYVKESLLEKLSLAHLRAWASDTTQALRLLKEVQQEISSHGLHSDTLLSKRINSLEKMIDQKQCELNTRAFLAHVELLKSRFKAGFYAEAYIPYQEATKVKEHIKNCPTAQDLSSLDNWFFIPHAAQYQELLQAAWMAYHRMEEKKDYDTFLMRYHAAQNHYTQKELAKHHIKPQALSDFTAFENNQSLVVAAIHFYATKDQHTKTIELLEVLRKQGLSSRELRPVQEYAAQKAAEYFSQNQKKNSSARDLAEELTQNDDWYKYFTRQFVRSF